jgi:hypothetical protein
VLICGVADIEENIWAPRYGLKGQLDGSLLIQLSQPNPQAAATHSGDVSGRSYGASSGGSSGWGRGGGGSSGGGRGCWQQQGSGWSGGGGSGRGWVGAGSGGCGRAGGGFKQQQEWQQWQQYQQQQQQQGSGAGWSGHGTGGVSAGAGRGVLAQVDMNQSAAGSGGTPGAVPWTTVAGVTAATSGGPAVGGTDDGARVFKGRVSGAAAAIKAYRAGHAAVSAAGDLDASVQHGQQQQQQAGQVRSLASGGSRPPAAAPAAGGGGGSSVSGRGQGSGYGSGPWGSGGQRYHQRQADAGEVLIVPFEFKTGKPYFSHKAQVRKRT